MHLQRHLIKSTTKMIPLLDGVWLAVKLCCHIMRTLLKIEIFVAAYLVLPMASMVAGEAPCKYYTKMFEAKEMECFLSRDGQYPVCKTGDVSKEHCHIRTRQQHMCVKWPVTTSITCRNNTYWKEMEGTDQDCAADQDSLDCTKEFSSDPENPTGKDPRSLAPAIKSGWTRGLCALFFAVLLIPASCGLL